jgi:hypothetical protein
MLKLLQRSIPLTILAVLLATVAPNGAQAQSPRDAAVVYQEHIDATNRGSAAAAAAVFTDDGVLIIGGCPAGTGCVGTAIQARIQASINANLRGTIVSIRRNNNIITAVEQWRGDPMRAAGIERAVFKVTLTFTGDKISRRVVEPDLSDPQTARFAAPPVPPTPAVIPPQTGDGGLISNHRGQTQVPYFAGMLLSVLLAGLILTRRRI